MLSNRVLNDLSENSKNQRPQEHQRTLNVPAPTLESIMIKIRGQLSCL